MKPGDEVIFKNRCGNCPNTRARVITVVPVSSGKPILALQRIRSDGTDGQMIRGYVAHRDSVKASWRYWEEIP